MLIAERRSHRHLRDLPTEPPLVLAALIGDGQDRPKPVSHTAAASGGIICPLPKK
jgi:hypothetical protein